jgi:hypothetical protein
MSNVIPNEETFIGYLPGTLLHKWGPAVQGAPTLAEIGAALDLTDFVVSLNASSTGNTVATPRLKRRFETSVPGTVTATFSCDMYRDNEADTAWDTLPRAAKGTWIVMRFGGTGAAKRPAATQKCEVWTTDITARTASPLNSGAAQTFTVTASVPYEPAEDYVVPGA